MNCILCLNLEQIKCKKIHHNDYLLFRDYLYVCHQYLTVEFEFGDFEDCTDEQKYEPICSKCFPSVKKLVQLNNEILEFSNSFSKEILQCRSGKDVKVDPIGALKEGQVEEIKSKVEEDVGHEGIDAFSFVETQLKDENDEVEEEEDECVFEQNYACEIVKEPLQQHPTSVHHTVRNNKEKINLKNIPILTTESTDVDLATGILPVQPLPGDDIWTSPRTEEEVQTVVKPKPRISNYAKNSVKNGAEMRTCDICLSVVTVKFFNRHVQRMHSNKSFQCDIEGCVAVFTSEKGLRCHTTLKHMERDPLTSLVCKYDSCDKKEFKTRSHLWHHYEYYHKPSDEHHICEHCGKSFNIKGRLAAHIRVQHNTNEKFACTHCDKSYAHKCLLKKHIQFVHTKEVSYICHLCGKSLSSRRQLKDHYRIHTGDKHKCKVCGQLYSSTTALIIHRKKAHR